MSGESTSANMNLILPGVGTTLGPTWATDLNASLSIIDSHNHSSGSGVPITPDGLDISSDLGFQNNNATALKSARMQVQSAALAGASDLGCIYVTGVDLYFNDINGNHVRITESGGVAGTPGSISNLTSPASASYVGAGSKFVWQSDVSTPAIMDSGYLVLRNISTSGYGLTLTPPTLSSNYTITLPALPASTKFMVIDNSGNMSAPYTVDNSTLAISFNQLIVKPGGITSAELAADSVGTTQLVDGEVTRPKLVAVGQQISSSSGTANYNSASRTDITNLTVTITTTGRPVALQFISTGSATASRLTLNRVAAGVIGLANIYLMRDSTDIANSRLGFNNAGLNLHYAPSIISHIDTPAAGTYTYKAQAQIVTDGTLDVVEVKLIAYEL